MHTPHSGYSIAEELFHAISHGAGVILSIAGLSWMLYVSIEAADPWRISASIVYGISLITLFLLFCGIFFTFFSMSSSLSLIS